MDPALEQRRPKGKRRRRNDINKNHLQLYEKLKSRNLQGVLLDSAVWICAEDDVVHILDCLCLGNLDGGSKTADHVKELLKTVDKTVSGTNSVRLSIDEAFFMVYALDILTVHECSTPTSNEAHPLKAIELDTISLWQKLQHIRRDFVTLYLAYHHFRSKGWIVRTGLQYGVDYVLYQQHPALAHSDYSVIIVPINGGREPVTRPPLYWHDVQIANRLSTQVGKRLLLFYIQENGHGDHANPKCVSNFSVQERLMRRWVPESMRPV